MDIVIMGGGKVGESLARRILQGRHAVRLIELDKMRCRRLANALDVEVICGSGTDTAVLERAGVRGADCFIAISGNDADNLVAAQMAKRYFSAKKVIARANDPRNLETMRVLGVDYAVSSAEIIAQIIEQEANLMQLHLVASINKGRGQICSVARSNRSCSRRARCSSPSCAGRSWLFRAAIRFCGRATRSSPSARTAPKRR